MVFLETHLDEVFADAVRAEFVTAGFDTHRLGCWAKAKSPRDAVDEQGGILVFELNHLAAVDADEVIVIGGFEKIRIVDAFISPEVDLAKEAALDQQRNRTIDRGPGGFRVNFAGFFEKLFCGEMIVLCEGSFHDNIALRGSAQSAFLDKSVEAFFDFCVHSPFFSQKNE